jgi:hypothetical protein
MRRNLTLAIDEDLLRLARIAAAERNASLTDLIRKFLEETVSATRRRKASVRRLRKLMEERPLGVGKVTWTRDELHER